MAKKSKMPVNKLPAAKPDVGPCSVKQTKESIAQERRWKAEDALNAISRAEDYKKDKQLMSDVRQLAKDRMESLKKI